MAANEERDMQSRIKQRIRAGLLDYQLIFQNVGGRIKWDHLDDAFTEPPNSEIQEILATRVEGEIDEPIPNDLRGWARRILDGGPRVEWANPAVIGLLYLGLREVNRATRGGHFAEIVEEGIHQALATWGVAADVDVDIQIDQAQEIARLSDQELGEFDPGMLEGLRITGAISYEEWRELVGLD